MKLLVKFVLMCGCFLPMIAMDQDTLNRQLSEAARAGSRVRVEELIAQGARGVNDAFLEAARGGHLEVVKVLVNKYHANDFYNAIRGAARRGSCDIIKFLIEHGAGKRELEGALMEAAYGGHLDIVRFLINEIPVLSTRVDDVMPVAASAGHIDIVRFLIEHGVPSYSFDVSLMMAVKGGHLEVVSFLELCLIDGFEEFRGNPLAFIKNNLDRIQKDPDIFVLWSIILHKPAILDFLLGQCPEAANAVYATKKLGPMTALMIAASCGFVDMVERLVRAGADITVRNSKDENAAALARKFGHEDIAMMLSDFPLAQ